MPGGKHWFLIRLIIWPVIGLCFLFFSFFILHYKNQWRHQMQKPNFVLSGKLPEEKLWKIKVTGLTSWEHTFPPVADRCTWIDQICEIWGLLSFWRGENLSKSTDWAASHSQILMLRFCSSLALASLGLYPSSFAFLLKLLLCRGLDQNLLSKKRALWWFNPGKSVKSTFDLFVALFWSARCFEVNPLVVLQ